MKPGKKFWNALFFLCVMGLTFYAVLHGQDPKQIVGALARMSPAYLGAAACCGLFFVCAEGWMIRYLLKGMGTKSGLLRCIGYSFVGFFYSGITPSATGGQPMQLYYMKKDGNRLSDSSVVLMTVAVIYKFVLVVIGTGILLLWHRPLRERLLNYLPLYLLGLMLNVVLVGILLGVMAAPNGMYRLLSGLERMLVRCRILKYSACRTQKILQFVDGYREAVHFLWTHKKKVGVVVMVTFLQRCSVFFLTWFVYKGFGLAKSSMTEVVLLQASVYIAVDMLPVPGAQGITELMYHTVFADIFTGRFLMPSLYVTRGINFYFLLIVSLFVTLGRRLAARKSAR